jgi:hypothetical protein
VNPPVRRPRRRGSLKDAIQTVFTQEPAKEIAPNLRGGRDNPVVLGTMTSVDPRLPTAAAEHIYRNQDATDGDYYNLDLGDYVDKAARLVRNEGQWISPLEPDTLNGESDDGLARYLGLPQVNRSLDLSPYSPTRGTRRGGYVRVPRLREALLDAPGQEYSRVEGRDFSVPGNPIRRRPSMAAGAPGAVRMMLDATEAGPARISGDALYAEGDAKNNSGALLANFTMDRGEDERGPYVSIYDRYDLNLVPLADRVVGRPWEYYDRIYYDPETYEPLDDLAPARSAGATLSPRERKARNP